jgi:hypothetical protein
MTNQLVTLLLHTPDEAWSWASLSEHHSITYDFVMSHDDEMMNWRYDFLCKNPNIARNMSDELPIWWSYWQYSSNPNITIHDILAVDDLDWFELSRNLSIPIQYIIDNSGRPWQWYFVTRRNDVTIAMIMEYRELPWDRYATSRKITSLPGPEGLELEWIALSRTLHLTIDLIRCHIDKWLWREVSFNDSLTIDIVLEYSHHFNRIDGLSIRSGITIDMVVANPQIPWNWIVMGVSPYITIDMIKTYPGLPWSWPEISANPAISMDDIRNNPGLPWDGKGLSSNPNITAAFIISRPDIAWNYGYLSTNSFDHRS